MNTTFYFSNSDLQQENFSIDNLTYASNLDYKPDVYYIIFDAYPRSDQLLEHFGYDNREMIAFLEDNQFYVAHKSHANYPMTPLSLASSMNMQYMDFTQVMMDGLMWLSGIKKGFNEMTLQTQFSLLSGLAANHVVIIKRRKRYVTSAQAY